MARDQTGYQERYNDLLSRYNSATARIAELTETKERRKTQQTVLAAFTDAMKKQEQTLDEFMEGLWVETVEKATVFSDHRIVFTLMNSAEIES